MTAPPDAREEPRAEWLGARFAALFGETPRLYRSPGRVNLIGEHTDYNDGFVLPAALALACHVAGTRATTESWSSVRRAWARRSRRTWRTILVRLPVIGRITSSAWPPILRRSGHAIAGATLLIDSDVPLGAGLSSSAALEVGVATALLDLAGTTVEPAAMARMCQQAEHEYVGARCGIMDYFIACHAREATALMLDCRSLEHQFVPMALAAADRRVQ